MVSSQWEQVESLLRFPPEFAGRFKASSVGKVFLDVTKGCGLSSLVSFSLPREAVPLLSVTSKKEADCDAVRSQKRKLRILLSQHANFTMLNCVSHVLFLRHGVYV